MPTARPLPSIYFVLVLETPNRPRLAKCQRVCCFPPLELFPRPNALSDPRVPLDANNPMPQPTLLHYYALQVHYIYTLHSVHYFALRTSFLHFGH